MDQLGSSSWSIHSREEAGGETEAALLQIQAFSHPFSIFSGILLASWPFGPTLAKCPQSGGWASCTFRCFFL